MDEKNEMQTLDEIKFNLEERKLEEKKSDRVGDIVEAAYQQAAIAQVKNDEGVQEQLLEGAKQTIQNKVDAIKDRAEQEAKEAHFNNKKDACECFGYSEKTTEKWAVNYMGWWHNLFTAIWITIGMVTFAPITFIGKKLVVIFKKTWVAMLVAVLIYLAVIFIPILINYLHSIEVL